jgi:hypothetical protein
MSREIYIFKSIYTTVYITATYSTIYYKRPISPYIKPRYKHPTTYPITRPRAFCGVAKYSICILFFTFYLFVYFALHKNACRGHSNGMFFSYENQAV